MKDPATMLVALSTAPDLETARTIARVLVSQRLVACVNLVPCIHSLYVWQGELHDESEVLMILKFRREDEEAVRQELRAAHPYETPEFVALNVAAVDPDYLDWLCGVTHREPA